MKYLVLILLTLLLAVSGVSYWYYNKTEQTISALRENNVKLKSAIELSEQAIDSLQTSYAEARQQIELVNQENIRIRRNNDRLVEKFGNSDISLAAEAKPELIERIINRGTVNAFRCLELLSGAELTESERNADNDTAFNNECPWLFNTLVRP